MSATSATRWFVAVTVTAAVIAGVLLWDGMGSLRVTDAQIAAGPPEDTLGFGIYPTLLLLGCSAFLALAWLWRRAVTAHRRTAVSAVTVFVVLSLAFNVWAYSLLRARVFK